MLQPILRFPEFTEEWKLKKIADVYKAIKGAPLSKADISETGNPFILYGELYTTYGEIATEIVRKTDKAVDKKYYSKKGDVVIPTSGESPEEISTATCIMEDGVILAGDLNIYRGNEVDGRFFSYTMNHSKKYDVARIAQGASIIHVQAEEIGKISIAIPGQKEQEKICEFLHLIDEKINHQKSIIADHEKAKKGYMQRLFDQEIRFKDDDGKDFPEWEKLRFNAITTPYNVRNKQCKDLEIYSINNQEGFVPQDEQFENAGYLKDTNTSIYMIVPPNHFAYNPARINVGSIGYQNVGYDVQVSSLYEVFKTTEKCNDKFLWYYFHTELFNQMVMKYGEGGVRVYYYYDKLCETPIDLPCLEEQKKIATFLALLDAKIEAEKTILKDWQQYKKALLQQMFV